MFDNTNPYTIRIEETNGQKRYFVAFIDGQGIFRESEVSYEVYTQFCRFVKCERNLRRSDERHLEQSELTEETLCRRALHKSRSLLTKRLMIKSAVNSLTELLWNCPKCKGEDLGSTSIMV